MVTLDVEDARQLRAGLLMVALKATPVAAAELAGSWMLYLPSGPVVPEKPLFSFTIAPEIGAPVSHDVTVPARVPWAGALHVGNLKDPILVRQLKLPVEKIWVLSL